MRKYKFRVWDKENKKMGSLLSFCQLGQSASGATTLGKWYDNDVDIDGTVDDNGNIIMLQFTEVHDKNDIEIYEGDIVYQEFLDSSSRDGFTGVVMFYEGCWWIDNQINDAVPLWSEINVNVVIGNSLEDLERAEK